MRRTGRLLFAVFSFGSLAAFSPGTAFAAEPPHLDASHRAGWTWQAGTMEVAAGLLNSSKNVVRLRPYQDTLTMGKSCWTSLPACGTRTLG